MAERKKLNPENVSDALKYYTEHKYMDCYSLANNLKEQGYGWDDRDIGRFEAKNNKHYSMEQGMQKGDSLVGAYIVRNLLRGEKDFIDENLATCDDKSSVYQYIRVADNNPDYTKKYADHQSSENRKTEQKRFSDAMDFLEQSDNKSDSFEF